ncbi:pyridoxine biosynthesis [Klebsormidium nitens]|uniref:glutaminase n=1 Tax=Klebsormidium nitens TaxID=105231 RepID=A0A1Y1IDQ0_KLENI|nr:pyridoxine biosynthesis [Klebsormidium nitens]|eukprot:GAQ87231.1 pyridoxine biosynthesis [Klebsormidium nitens]
MAGEAAPVDVPAPRIGVLAIQGSFREHCGSLRKCGLPAEHAVEVRTPDQLQGLHGLIIPGGESTTMANVATRNGLLPALKDFSASGKPVWGTCAGLIFLADRALGQKKGGQALLGGLNVTVHRNFFGSQVNSFETELPTPKELQKLGGEDDPTFRAIFIRAPAIVEKGPSVDVLAQIDLPEGTTTSTADENGQEINKVIIAVRQDQLLATAFHPELTADTRWHSLFLRMVTENRDKADAAAAEGSSMSSRAREAPASSIRPADLPIFKEAEKLDYLK